MKSNFKIFNLILLSLILFSLQSIGQIRQEWVQRYNSAANGTDEAYSMAVDDSGNVYVTGCDGNGTGFDYATIKYNSSGVQQWISTYNGPGNGHDKASSIAIDASGNVYVTGYSLGVGTNNDFATIKYNSSGIELWVQRYNGAENLEENPRCITVDASGNVYVTGLSTENGNYSDYATIKYSSSGVQQWISTYNGTGHNLDDAESIAVDASGNVYVTGTSQGSGSSQLDYATVKYNSSGVQQWVKRYNGPGNNYDWAKSIAVDASGNVYVTGYSNGTPINPDYATIKYNSSGVQQWIQRYNGLGNFVDQARSMTLDDSGNVYVTGSSDGNGTGSDYATIKYNSSGVQQWLQRYNGSGNTYDEATSIAVDASGNVYVSGYSHIGLTYTEDYATVKYNSSGVEQWVQKYNGKANLTDVSRSIGIDASGNVYVTGSSIGEGTDFDHATIKYSLACTLECTSLIEGLYNPNSNLLSPDTVRFYLHSIFSPYITIDSSKAKLNSSGFAATVLPNIQPETDYYLVLKNRNSIETWSSSGINFSRFSKKASYQFTDLSSKAFGNNMKQVDTSPVSFAIYSGDADQDGNVDVTDLVNVYNDAKNFVAGYVTTDMTGDNFVDVTDLILTFNNSNSIVSVITP